MTSYEELLDKAKEELPEDITQEERFSIPKVKGHVEGNKTIISNFVKIAKDLGREPKHMLKYVLGEIAAPGEIVQNKRVIIGSKISSSKINNAISEYAEKYVFCRECGKPETDLLEEDDVYIVKCRACGARESVYS